MKIIVTQPLEESSYNQKQQAGGFFSDYSQRAQCLRAVVLGGNEGIVAITVLLTAGLGTLVHDAKSLLIVGFTSLVAGALCIATAEFVSCYTQVDIMKSQANRCRRMERNGPIGTAGMPNPTHVALAASLAYTIAGAMPLLAAGFLRDHKVRLGVTIGMACLSMLGLGTIGASLGKAPIARSCARVLVGGCVEIMILVAKERLLRH